MSRQRPSKSKSKPGYSSLEPRQLLATVTFGFNELTSQDLFSASTFVPVANINLTQGDDTLIVSSNSNSDILLYSNGTQLVFSNQFNRADPVDGIQSTFTVRQLRINGFGGDDLLVLNPNTPSVRFSGGDGLYFFRLRWRFLRRY